MKGPTLKLQEPSFHLPAPPSSFKLPTTGSKRRDPRFERADARWGMRARHSETSRRTSSAGSRVDLCSVELSNFNLQASGLKRKLDPRHLGPSLASKGRRRGQGHAWAHASTAMGASTEAVYAAPALEEGARCVRAALDDRRSACSLQSVDGRRRAAGGGRRGSCRHPGLDSRSEAQIEPVAKIMRMARIM